MTTFRTKKNEREYKKEKLLSKKNKKCALCEKESIKEFKYWRVVQNEFPYDYIASLHNMLVTKRHVSRNYLNKVEKKELEKIHKSYFDTTYDCVIQSTIKTQSLPQHFHLHLIVNKERH